MNNTPEAVVSTLKSMPGYGTMFAKAFPGEKDPVTFENMALTAPYFQSGKVWSLGEAVSIIGSTQLGISLAKADTQEIVAFLQATTGVQPKVVYPILPESGVDTPKPILN